MRTRPLGGREGGLQVKYVDAEDSQRRGVSRVGDDDRHAPSPGRVVVQPPARATDHIDDVGCESVKPKWPRALILPVAPAENV
jgi:hypothetical protein